MAKYRQVYTEFWRDSFAISLSPEDRYFFLYLLTNPATKQCGIYELPMQIMASETGYNHDTVKKLLSRFESYGKIKYDSATSEVAIKNFPKYNANVSPKVQILIKNELSLTKSKDLIQYVYGIDTVSIDYGYTSANNKNNNKDNNKNKEKEKESEDSASIFESLISKSFEVFSKQNIEGVFFNRVKEIYSLSDDNLNRLFLDWKKKKEATGQAFRTEQHLKNSFNSYLDNAPKIVEKSSFDLDEILEMAGKSNRS
jgi:hypothetical protein